MERKYYEVEFGKRSELEDNSFCGTPDRYSMCIIAEHHPSFEEAKEFCKSDMEKWGYDTICAVIEIDYDEAHNFFDMDNEDSFPILK